MKPFWLGCAGLAVLVIPISAIIFAPSAGMTGRGTEQAATKNGLQTLRGHRRAVSRDGTADQSFEKIPAGGEREATLRRLAGRRATDDPAAAEHWAGALKLESEREVALNHIAVEWGKTNPIMAIELAHRHNLSQGIVDTISGRWGKTDPQAAMKWALGLSSETEQENTLLQIFAAHAEIDPAAAALLVTEKLPPGPGQDEAVMTVLYHWLRVDEAAAVAWVANFPDGELRVRSEAEIRGFRAHRAAISDNRQAQDRLR